MAAPRTADLNSLLDTLRADQRRRWRNGERPPVEDYLQRQPAVHGDVDGMLELAYHEIVLREELGESPTLAEYRERFPQLAPQLEALFEVHRVMASVHSLADANSSGGAAGSQLSADVDAEKTRIPGYELLKELGSGGMGRVYLARQTGLNRLVALKMILAGNPSPEAVSRFRIEAETVARLQHPNIVQIYEVGEVDGCPFLALEFVSGGSLARRLDGAPIPHRQAVELIVQLARAAEYAHRQGVIHRDLKPANILLAGSEPTDSANQSLTGCEPKITDFGLAKRLDSDLAHTQSGTVLGTPSYMAPEQAEGRIHQIGPATDVYALGAILYELLTGRPPFRAATLLETLEQARSLDPVPPRFLQPKLPPDLETICLKCLEKEPGRRYSSAQELADDLTRYSNGESIHARSPTVLEQVTRLVNRNQLSLPDARFHTAVYFWLAPVPFLLQLLLFVAAADRPFYPLASLGLMLLIMIVIMAALLAAQRLRPMELPGIAARHVWSARLGLVLGVPPLLVIAYLTAPADRPWNPLPIYPLWTVTAGVGFFHLGSVIWGRLYLLGLGMFAAAILMAWRLELSPLVLGLVLGVMLGVLGLHFRRATVSGET